MSEHRFGTPEEARAFIEGVREGARFMGDDDPVHRRVDAALVPPPEPWATGSTGEWVVLVNDGRGAAARSVVE